MVGPTFKKRKKIKKRPFKKSSISGNASSSSEDESTTFSSLINKKRNRQIIRDLETKRGVDTAQLLKNAHSGSNTIPNPTITPGTNNATQDDDPTAHNDLRERLRGTFSGGTTTNDGNHDPNDTSGAGGGIMGQKHRDAMEEFVRRRMTTNENPTADKKKTDERATTTTTTTTGPTADDPYAAIAEESARLLGRHEPHETAEAEGDVGAGGAVLGGTGLAEVILPVEERIEAAKLTERRVMGLQRQRAAAAASSSRGGSGAMSRPVTAAEMSLPTSFGSGPGKRRKKDGGIAVKRKDAIAVVSTSSTAASGGNVKLPSTTNLPGSYSHNFRQHAHEYAMKRKERDVKESSTRDTDVRRPEDDDEGENRIGFAAMRKGVLSRGEGGEERGAIMSTMEGKNKSGEKRASDDRVWSTFVKRHRERPGKRG
mmetsp:Transcript_2005/g.2510  ORF Transcript_2005/g.2510 Transcript_2005/m.2510 type:complete len:427 (-) Transcript_2005:2-1282(-)|eukprot:CAMPEP_0172491432 /NCGR_PEP_ID=MMETSP1066-20121228/22261_1 /TAXON_ID=671091 /ORGANISM="Coscinodiscus wailesii, Strain CCMP2513" /LENGTH=426 /DNA_ID=CAMNT_0013260483 /DNA_START=58 /DNA_END=1334 /DNA_ORIENTATION=-